MYSEFMAFVTDDESVATVRAWAQRQGFPADCVETGGPDTLALTVESKSPPRYVFVDMDGQEDPRQVAANLVNLCGATTRLIAVGSVNDVDFYRSMLSAGVVDYLVKPLSPEALTAALVFLMRGKNQGADEPKAIVVYGVRGGVGASSLAVNLAWLIAHELKLKCALLDLDLQFGASALALDIEPGHGFREILMSPQRVDSLMVAGAIVNESENFAVMSAEEPIEEPIAMDHGALTLLLKELKSNYRAIVVDMPRHLMASQKRLFVQAQEIVLVTEMSLVGIRDTSRVRSTFKTLGVTSRVTQVVTHADAQHSGAVDEASFLKGVGAKIDFFLPDDSKNMVAASNAGKTLGEIAKGSPLTKSLQQLAHYLMEPPEEEGEGKKGAGRSKGMLHGLFGGHHKASADGHS